VNTNGIVAMAATITLLFGTVGEAAEIRVLCSKGLQAVMEELAPQFEQATGHKVIVEIGLAAVFKRQIEAGEPFDVAVLTPPLIDELIKQGKIAGDSRTVIARTGLGLLIRAGARKPDIGTAEAFRRTLLDANSITYVKEGASGVYFAGLIERLEIAAALQSKTRLAATADEVIDLVIRGEAEFGVLPLSEILPVRGGELGGAFPAEVQSYIVMTAGVASSATQAAVARDLIKYLTAPAAFSVIQAKGMERN
jgi:molybdate transport system substrate-binding protein